MADVGGTDAVMEKIEKGAVGAINCLKGTFGPVPGFVGEMGNIAVGVLKPGVGGQPHVDHQIRQSIEAENPCRRVMNGCGDEQRQHRHKAKVGAHHPLAEGGREQAPFTWGLPSAVPEM